MTNSDLAVCIARLEERLEAVASDMHDIKEALVGTGSRPGLIERVTIQEQRSAAIEARVGLLEVAPKREGTGLSTTKLLGIMATMAGAIAGLIELLAKGH